MIWLSPTMLTSFAGSRGDFAPDGGGCPRKWAYNYVARIPRLQSKGAELGTDVQDTQVDPYLRDGRWFDFTRKSGEIAVQLAPLLPQPKTVAIRQRFWMPVVPDEYGYMGELDVWHPDSAVVPGLTGGASLVGDVKTTVDLDWALSDEDLPKDFQAIIYAAHAVLQRNASVIDLVWWYVRTRKPHRVQRSRARMTDVQVMAAFERVDSLGRVVARLKQLGPAPETMPVNVRTCEAYGGCSYRTICNLSPAQVHAGVSEGMMSNNPQAMLQQFMNGGASAPLTPGSHAWFVDEGVKEGHVPQALVAREGVEGAFTKLNLLAPAGWFQAKQASIAPQPTYSNQISPGAPAFPAGTLTAAVAAISSPQLPFTAQPIPGPSPGATASFLDSLRPPVAAPTPPAINPPESLLPPAPPVGAVAAPVAAPKATRGPNKPKADDGAAPTDVLALARLMKDGGIRRLRFDGAQIIEMELA